jgi:hypothetical protein
MGNGASGIGHRELGIGKGNGASGIGHRELGIGNWYLVTNDNSQQTTDNSQQSTSKFLISATFLRAVPTFRTPAAIDLFSRRKQLAFQIFVSSLKIALPVQRTIATINPLRVTLQIFPIKKIRLVAKSAGYPLPRKIVACRISI